MKLIPVDFCEYNFDKFIKTIDIEKIYLAKYNDQWLTGRWSPSRCKTHGPGACSWDFYYGGNRTQGSPNREDKLDPKFQEMYEIYDEDLIIKQAKRVLLKQENNNEVKTSGY